MTEFTKTKMNFTLALLGTLFAIHKFVEKIEDWGFEYPFWDWVLDLKVIYVFLLIAGLLSFTVYCYALSLRSAKPSSWAERLGNYSYGLATMVLPFYGFLYLVHLLAEQLEDRHMARAVRIVPLALAVVGFMLWQVLALWMRKHLGDKDHSTKLEHLVELEIKAVDRAPDFLEDHHYDLSVIEAWKAVEARLRRVLLQHGVTDPGDDPQTLIDTASRAGIFTEATGKMIRNLHQEWKIAVSTEPLSKEAAEMALRTARDILATIPVHGPQGGK
jgi:hypothetical protein